MKAVINLARTFALLLLLGFGFASQSVALNLDSLLIRSIGGPAALDTVRQMTSFRATGAVVVNGLPGQFEEIVAPPRNLYLSLVFPQFHIIQAYDGVTAWQQDLNGRIAELSGFEREELLRSVYFETYAYLVPSRFAGTKTFAGDTTIADRRYYRIKFLPEGTDTVTALFDAQTGLRAFAFSNLDNIRTETATENYTSVSGVLVPFVSRAIASNTPISMEFSVDSAMFNVPVDSSIFKRPDIRTQDFRFPADSQSVVIPFQYIDGHIYIVGNINGKKKARFILDSGASATIFHAPVIQYLGLPVVGTMPARGVAGYDEAQLVKTDSITIGPLALFNQIGGSIDLTMLGNPSAAGMAFGGVLGYDFLSRFPVMVDYQNSCLVVFNPDSSAFPAGGHEVPFDLTMQVPTVTITVAGDTGRFIVDLGNAFDLILHQQFVDSRALKSKLIMDSTSNRQLGGIGGGISSQTASAPQVQIGDLTLTHVPVTLSGSSEGLTGSTEIAGNIGNELLRRFKVLFDYRRQRLFLYPIGS